MTLLAWPVPLLALTKEERLFIWTGVFAAVIIVAAMFLARVDRWRKRQFEAEDDSPEHLGSFRELYERGEISKGEYDRVMKRIAAKAFNKPNPVVPAAKAELPASPIPEAPAPEVPGSPPEAPESPTSPTTPG